MFLKESLYAQCFFVKNIHRQHINDFFLIWCILNIVYYWVENANFLESITQSPQCHIMTLEKSIIVFLFVCFLANFKIVAA